MRAACQHLFEKLGYLQWHEDAEQRRARGEGQDRCVNCELWRWPDEQAACPRFETTAQAAARARRGRA